MTIGHQLRREKGQFHPRHVIVMMFGTAAILYTAAVYSMVPAEVLMPERHAAAAPATAMRLPEPYVPVQSLGYVVFDWSETDGGVPGFAPLPAAGDSKGAQ
jgi:hypothetical protein